MDIKAQYLDLSFKSRSGGLLFSGLTCNELGSCHSCIYDNQANPSENQQLFLDPSENWSRKRNCCPENWRNRQVDIESHSS